MKFPSIKTLTQGAKQTFKRFPIELLFALTTTVAGCVLVEVERINPDIESWCIRLIMMGNLGLLLSLSATLYIESNSITGGKKYLIKAIAVAIAILLLLLINPKNNQSDWLRFFLFSLSFHLLVSFAAYIGKAQTQGFWQFNKTLFLRFLTSALYSAVLFGGLAAALGAVNLLFNVKFEFDTFAILWIWIVGMFSTTFFLSGVPANYSALDKDTSYPGQLKAFTQYVLIPLATIYLIILLAYEAKILVEWNLPKGYVSYLILGYAVFGILSLLLVYPIREHEENKWLKTFARSFYFLLLPLLALLFVAVGTRVFDYGITEHRYFLIALALWLLFISIYFLAFKKQNIKLIPVSLCVITLLSVYGPQGAFSVSEFSQKRILVSIFKRHNAFKDGKLLPIGKMSQIEGEEAINKLRYLVNQHDLVSLQPYIAKDLTSVTDSIEQLRSKNQYAFKLSRYEQRAEKFEWIVKYLGLTNFDHHHPYRGFEPGEGDPSNKNILRYYQLRSSRGAIAIQNYDYMLNANQTDSTLVKINGETFRRNNTLDNLYELQINGEKVSFDAITLAKGILKNNKLDRFKEARTDENQGNENYKLPDSLLTFTKQTLHYIVDLKLSSFGFSRNDSTVLNSTHLNGVYLIREIKK
jgi:hypothetical protein